ncbi:MAG: hypothetical protein A2176_09765 [Spirochaetes bacterium RBG_13_51_14]|nr:MAG: hypothetical protein A2176_09765 [Spirochaetes bacterium RBG_13_51_14]
MVDYHAHTNLCGHATGSVSEYIESALSKGIREIGFSDHAPLPESIRGGYTMPADEVDTYIKTVEEQRDRCAHRIAVRVGFEVDYPLRGSFASGYLTDSRIDYLIGSCHFIDGWPFDHPEFIDGYRVREIDDIHARYFSILGSLAESGLFNVVGHFDIVKKFGFRASRDFLPAIEGIARSMAANGVAAEVNTAGLLHPAGEMYPSDSILRVFFNCNVPVTLGSDAHSADQIGYQFPLALEKITGAGYRKISGFLKRKRYDIAV